jgi:chaperonin GroES
MASMKIRPLGNRVLVQRSKPPTSKGGILLPETAKEKPKEGVVVAAGPGKTNDEGKLDPISIKIGDRVLFGSYAGTEVKCPDTDDEYLILSEDDVLGILS